jgi:hypothetical protein
VANAAGVPAAFLMLAAAGAVATLLVWWLLPDPAVQDTAMLPVGVRERQSAIR